MNFLKDSSSQFLNGTIADPISHYQFEDADEMGAFLPEDVHLTLLERKPFECESVVLNLGMLQFYFNHVNCSLHAVGNKQLDFLTFSMIFRGNGKHCIENNRLVTEDYLFGFDFNHEADLVFPGNAIYCAIYIQLDVFWAYTEIMGRVDLTPKFLASNYVYIPESFHCLRIYLNKIYALLIQRSPLLQKTEFQQIILQDFMPLFITALPICQERQVSAKMFRRSKLVKQTDDYMRSHIDQPLTLTDLSQALGASSRSLCYGFQEIFGMSPMSYLKILRLQGVYRALKAAQSNETTVTDTATQFGFYHLGYFAQDYKQMFGELPSETLKRNQES